MIDPKTGRMKRGPGEPARFFHKHLKIRPATDRRAAWLKAQTGYDVDPRTVQITEALRKPYYLERTPADKAADEQSKSHFFHTPMEMRTSERKTFGTCHQQWFWRYVEQLTPNRPATPLWFGSAWHEALAAWYRTGLERGPHPAETFLAVLDGDRKTWTDKVNEEDEVEFVDARALGVAMAEGYVNKYGRDEHMHILTTEQTFALDFKRTVGKKQVPFLKYRLTIDGLYRDLDSGRILILEHKTARQIKTDHLWNDNQAGSYYAAAPYVLPLHDLLKPGEKISGIEYNFARKSMPDERPVNADGHATNKPTKQHYFDALLPFHPNLAKATKVDELERLADELDLVVLGEVSKSQPAALFHREEVFRTPDEQAQQLQRIQDEATYMEAMRSSTAGYPVLKTPGDHCNWCPFKNMCELDESGDQDAVESYKQTTMKIEDPYLAYHTKAA